MTDGITDETRDSIIDDLNKGDKSQQEIADNNGVSQATVSNIKRGMERGKEAGKEQGMQEAFEKVKNFSQEDETDSHEEDDYWCSYCKAENGETVSVDYLDDACPNGHDLSQDWT